MALPRSLAIQKVAATWKGAPALGRYRRATDGAYTALLILHPALDEIDMRMTVCETAMAMNICTLLLMPLMEKSPVWDRFREMTARYREMIADGSDFLVGSEKDPASRAS